MLVVCLRLHDPPAAPLCEGSRRGSTSRGRTSSGRGSCSPSGSLPTRRLLPSQWRPPPSPSSARPRWSMATTRTPSSSPPCHSCEFEGSMCALSLSNKRLLCSEGFMCPHFSSRLTLAEYHEQEEIFKLRLGHLKKVCVEEHSDSFMVIQTLRQRCTAKRNCDALVMMDKHPDY